MHLQSHWALSAFSGMYPDTNPQSRCPPQPFSPIPGSMFLYYVSYKRQHGSACVSPGAGFNPPEFLLPCGLPVSCCLATSVVRSLSTGCPLRARRGPRGLPSPRTFMFLGGMKAAFVPSPSPGPWRAWRLVELIKRQQQQQTVTYFIRSHQRTKNVRAQTRPPNQWSHIQILTYYSISIQTNVSLLLSFRDQIALTQF